jgi:hypothetical protein
VGDREDSKKNAGSFDKLRTGSSTSAAKERGTAAHVRSGLR